jgi:hypothetical protein
VKDPEILKFFGQDEPDTSQNDFRATKEQEKEPADDQSPRKAPQEAQTIPLVVLPQKAPDAKAVQPPSQPPIHPQPEPPKPEQDIHGGREVSRYVIKFIPAENTHKKLIEYTDGTVQEIPLSAAERQQFGLSAPTAAIPPAITPVATPAPTFPRANTDTDHFPQENLTHNKSLDPVRPSDTTDSTVLPKKSNMGFYDLPEPQSVTASALLNKNVLNFILVPIGEAPALLLFKSHNIQENLRFNDQRRLIDWREFLKPSMYHNIEKPPQEMLHVQATPTNLSQGRTFIRREDYLRN